MTPFVIFGGDQSALKEVEFITVSTGGLTCSGAPSKVVIVIPSLKVDPAMFSDST